MNIARIKGLTWLGALIVGGVLGWDVYEFLRHTAELEQPVPEATLNALLDDVEQPEPPRENRVAYGTVLTVFRDMNWTGKAPPPPPVPKDPGAIAEVPKNPVSDLLKVMVLQVDTRDPAGSLAYVIYTDTKLARYNEDHKSRILRVGTLLFAPYEHIEVEAITLTGVTFSFTNDSEREFEIVPVEDYDMGDQPGIVVVDHAVMPQRERQIFANPNPTAFNPRATQEIRKNEFQIGLDDIQELNDDYSRILSQDLRYRTHRGPDGRVDGIQITNVAPNSLPARHGVTGGEVIKSINGHPVKSVNEAIAYVKKESEKTDTWVVVYEKQGRTYTRTYHSPVD